MSSCNSNVCKLINMPLIRTMTLTKIRELHIFWWWSHKHSSRLPCIHKLLEFENHNKIKIYTMIPIIVQTLSGMFVFYYYEVFIYNDCFPSTTFIFSYFTVFIIKIQHWRSSIVAIKWVGTRFYDHIILFLIYYYTEMKVKQE